MNFKKCAIIGCGFVGTTTAYTLVHSKLFSEIVLIDINRNKAEGEAMDLNDATPFISPVDIYAGDYSDLSDCGIIIISAGANQKIGETRIDLVQKNVKIFKSIVENITKYCSDAILLVVTNPVDILTYVTLKLSGFPKEHVIGSGTVLDTARLKYLIGKHLAVDSRNVHSFIIGEHGDSELPVWSSANVSGIDLSYFCGICGKCNGMTNLHNLFDEVKSSAYKIIEAKGATYYAVAEAIRRICVSIVRDEDSILPVSAYVDGKYGLHDICLGLPSVISSNGIRNVLEIQLNEQEKAQLLRSASILKDTISQLSLFEDSKQ